MPILDQHGKPIKATSTVGTGGTAIYGGFIDEKEKNASLRGQEKYRTYSDILANVSIVAAGVRYILNLIAKASWKAVPPPGMEDDLEAIQLADRFETALHGMETTWSRVVRRTAGYKFYGFSIQEWTAKLFPDGVVGFLDVEPRAQVTIYRWKLDDRGDIEGVYQLSPQTQKEIWLPRPKLVYIVDDALNDSPEGLGLFRHMVDSSRRLRRYEQLEGFGYETDLRGIPVGQAPIAHLQEMVKEGSINQAQMDTILAPMKEFIENHIKGPKTGFLMDSISYETQDDKETPSSQKKWSLELMKASVSSQKEIAEAIMREIHNLARVLNVEGLLLGENRGTQALSKDKSHNLFLVVDSTLGEMKEVYEADLRDPMWQLNSWPENKKPLLVPEPVQFKDVEQISSSLESLSRAGYMMGPDDPVAEQVIRLLGLEPGQNFGAAEGAAVPGGGEAGASQNVDDLEDDDVKPTGPRVVPAVGG